MSDQQLISRKQYYRHVVWQHSVATNAQLEHALAVMLQDKEGLAAGLTCYRTRPTPFAERDAELVQMLVPHVRNAIRRQQTYVQELRSRWLEDIVARVGTAAVWLESNGAELTRTEAASLFLQHHFPSHEVRNSQLPSVIRCYFQRVVGSQFPARPVEPLIVEKNLSSLRIEVMPGPSPNVWVLVLTRRGIEASLASKLTPRQLAVAACLLKGLSNEEIAHRENRSLATIRQQSIEVYRRLGVKGRRGLLQLAAGLGSSPESEAYGPR